jgi:Zn-dependent M32 family carboxypeptidase
MFSKLRNKLKIRFGRNSMAAADNVNYTDAMVDSMVEQYNAAPTRETVEELSAEFDKPVRSIIAKLSREGVYQPVARATKQGAPVVRKEELVAQIQANMGIEVPSLAKATKGDLQILLAAVNS